MDRVDTNRLHFIRKNIEALLEMEDFIEKTPTMVPDQAKQVYKEAKYALIDHLNECWLLDASLENTHEPELTDNERWETRALRHKRKESNG